MTKRKDDDERIKSRVFLIDATTLAMPLIAMSIGLIAVLRATVRHWNTIMTLSGLDLFSVGFAIVVVIPTALFVIVYCGMSLAQTIRDRIVTSRPHWWDEETGKPMRA